MMVSYFFGGNQNEQLFGYYKIQRLLIDIYDFIEKCLEMFSLQ